MSFTKQKSNVFDFHETEIWNYYWADTTIFTWCDEMTLLRIEQIAGRTKLIVVFMAGYLMMVIYWMGAEWLYGETKTRQSRGFKRRVNTSSDSVPTSI